MKLRHGSTQQRQQRWNVGTKVWFHGINPNPGRTGIVKRVSKPGHAFVLGAVGGCIRPVVDVPCAFDD